MKKILRSIPAFCWIMVFTIMNGSWIQVKGETPLPVVSYQGKVIQGVVKSAVDNMPLVGVTVVEKGTQNGTLTDLNGKYSITVAGADAILEFSFIGFNTEEIVVGSQEQIDLFLIEKIEQLTEIVVVGYGVQKKSDLTGAVAKVNSQEIQRTGLSDIGTALQGKAAGVFVTKGNTAPGEASKIYVRGPGSINNTDPLYVVDGFPLSGTYDLSDAESVEILKDASAAAIYGSRAANGVILVTTKRGKAGKPSLNFSMYQSIYTPLNIPDLVTSADYAKYKETSFINGKFDAGEKLIYHDIVNGDTIVPTNTDWIDELYQNGRIQNYRLDYSGGSEAVKLYTSLNYFKEDGAIIKTGYERFIINFNSDNRIAKWLNIGHSLNLLYAVKNPTQFTGNWFYRMNPYMPVYMPDSLQDIFPYGVLGPEYGFQGVNPVGNVNIFTKIERKTAVTGNIYFEIKPFKGLVWRTAIGGNYNMDKNTQYDQPYNFIYTTRDYDRLYTEIKIRNSWAANTYANYAFSLGKHNFSAMVGAEVYDSIPGYNYYMEGLNTKDGKITYNSTDVQTRSLTGDRGDMVSSYSFFGRLNYNYNDKYLLTVNARADYSSKFPPENRRGFFPSVSAGWRITKEPFMTGLADVMDLKIRAGYGSIGNTYDANYVYYSTFYRDKVYYVLGDNTDPASLKIGQYSNKFPNSNLRWENVVTTNIGFDLLLFNNQLEIINDFYIKNTKDMITQIDLPFATGLGTGSESSTFINAGNVRNIGNDLMVNYKGRIGEIQFQVGGTFMYNSHKVEELGGDESITKGDLSQFVTSVDGKMSSYYGYLVDGIYQESDTAEIKDLLIKRKQLKNRDTYDPRIRMGPGDFRFRDVNGDSILDMNDRVYLGDPWPDFSYGLNLGMEYKGIDFSLFFQGVSGLEVYNLNRRYEENAFGDFTFTNKIKDSWSPENPGNTQPRVIYGDPNKNLTTSSSYFVEDGDYFRLKTLVIGYSFPHAWLTKISMESLRIYANIQNVFTITQYTGLDPENGTGGNTDRILDEGFFPQSRTFQFGLNVGF